MTLCFASIVIAFIIIIVVLISSDFIGLSTALLVSWFIELQDFLAS